MESTMLSFINVVHLCQTNPLTGQRWLPKTQRAAYALFVFCLLLLLPTNGVYAGSKLLGPLVPITDAQLGEFGQSDLPAVAVQGDTVYAVWRDSRDYQPSLTGGYAIYLAKSTDGGQSWGANVLVSDPDWDAGQTDKPTVAIGPDGTVYVMWYLAQCSTLVDPARCGGQDRENDIRIALSPGRRRHVHTHHLLGWR